MPRNQNRPKRTVWAIKKQKNKKYRNFYYVIYVQSREELTVSFIYFFLFQMYPTNIRGTASGASALWFYVFAFSANKSFSWLLNTINLFGILSLYGAFIGLGSVFFYFFLPETEGCTLYEIEKHFAQKGNVFKTKVRKQYDNETYVSETLRTADIESHL